ncbi:glycosyltransferase family 4 protein [Nocardioides sp. GCM10027113]|uniref:glycosyltransferase family 4 protein n=1 Tax=unclassified Nocardioides TaxID=2615069 RepID=UPI003623DAD2
MHYLGSFEGRHVVFFSWRDTRNPEGGGAEVYLEQVARGLLERGARVTIFCAAHDEAPANEVVDGLRFVRRGSKTSVYLKGMLCLLMRRFGRIDGVVDVQNGLPFFTRLLTRKPVVVLVHHVHREQWPVVYPGLTGKIGWWIESRLSPRLYRRCQYVAVSQATRDELVELGVDRARIAVVHNGTEPALPVATQRSAEPSMCTVGRLVPHKQVEHAIDACVALREEVPGLRLTVVGSGWWEDELRNHVQRLGASDVVEFAGHVSERRKQEVYAASWLMALPSLKEGWGLVVGEAGMHGTPTVAYSSAGGTRESIEDGRSGLLAHDEEQFVDHLRAVLTDGDLRAQLAAGARDMSDRFTWGHARGSFAQVLASAMTGHTESGQDPDE